MPRRKPHMPEPSAVEVTHLLHRWTLGDRSALESLMPLVYAELRRVARRSIASEHPGHTLEATALVHEAYLRLVRQDRAQWKDRAHFFGVAAQMMRRILIDYARAARTDKRRVLLGAVQLDDATPQPAQPPIDFLDLHEALQELESFDGQKARVVELRYFGGLSVEEASEVLGISTATVKREWNVARAWLAHRLNARES
jgi:RNA polymerase sigma factor (TIGR02999 family)